MIGLLISALLVALVVLMYLRRPGGSGLFGGRLNARTRKRSRSAGGSTSTSIGGPFSAAAFGGFGGACRRSLTD